MEKNWVVVFTDAFLPKVEFIKALLLENNIPAIVLNQQDRAYTTVGDIQVLVDRENYLKALHLINN